MKLLVLLGRILFSSTFIVKGLHHFSSSGMQHAAYREVSPTFVPIAGIIALLGGLSILFGYKARIGAWLIVLFLLPTTFIMHPFWNSQDFYSTTMEQLCFMKNFSLLGAALLIAYFGSGPMSVDRKR